MIEQLIGQFSPESFSEWCREKFDRFTADPHEAPNAGDFPKARIVGYVQSLPDSDINRPLLVMSVYAGEQISERSSRRKQFDFARKQLLAAIDKPPARVKGLFTQGLFAFHDKAGNFRLSLVSGRADGKKLVYSDFKRQSFFIRPGLNNKTFRSRMAGTFNAYLDLTKAFSVETLTREFYNSLFAWYERAMAPDSKLTFPNKLNREDDDRTQLAEHVIRLITRLMFIWFIRQKNLIPDKIFDPAALKTLLKTFDPASPKQDNYYRAILQNLFFATLNCEIEMRAFANESQGPERREHFDIKLLYRYSGEFACKPEDVIQLFRGVPFLNGGLFECLDKKADYQDGFSRNPKCVAHIPNNLFFDEHGLITLFARYDFTVDENDPNDSDVALDPELLGKVFENLLGAYNPETRETARKQSGSFYTPREIVNYMVDESLVAHIRTQAPEIEEPVIRYYLGGEEPPDLPKPLRHKLVTAIYHCRILDPACGSGAFPMGLLLKMVHLLQRLDDNNSIWHEVVMAETEKALAEAESLVKAEKEQRLQRITETFEQNVNQPDYARKLYLIENCIFGVDIQPIAVQIAKLRTFITLVCDQEPDLTDVARNYRMLPLPNLETKFVAANSLIGLSTDFADGLKPAAGGSHLDDQQLKELRDQLAEVRHRHFRARDSREKNHCRNQDKELRGKIEKRLVDIACKPDAAKIAFYRAEIEKLHAKRKRVAAVDLHEITITEDSLGDILASTGPVQTILRVDRNKDKRDELDDSIRRKTRAIEAEESRAKNKSAFQEEADRVAAWDPYDQSEASPFFDPEWMFGFRGGFDIVIGNPPYVSKQAIIRTNKDFAQYAKTHFYVASGRDFDLFALFIEKSVQLSKLYGNLTFIVPTGWYTGDGFCQLRRFLMLQTDPTQFVNLPYDMFDNAWIDTTIFQSIKRSPIKNWPRIEPCVARLKTFDKRDRVTSQHSFQQGVSRLDIAEWFRNGSDEFLTRSDSAVLKLIGKIRKQSVPFGSCADIQRGVTPFNLTETPVHKNSRFAFSGTIRRYYFDSTETRYIRYDETLAEFKPARYFSGSRILLRELISRQMQLQATLTSDDFVTNKSMQSILPLASGPSIYSLLAVLNSKLMSWYFLNCSNVGNRDDFPKIVLKETRSLPFPNRALAVTEEDSIRLEERVKNILAAKSESFTADISALDAEVDRLVYELYGLSEDEIAIVEGRDGAAKPPKPAKPSAARQPRKSVMTEDPDLS